MTGPGAAAQETVAVVFDFDDTLAPDTVSGFLASLGIEPRAFWAREVDPLLEEGWDPVPAYLYALLERSRSLRPPMPITRDMLAAWGRKVRLYEGATRVFDRLRRAAAAVDRRVTVEFYVVSSGIGEILRTTRIARAFTAIWACDFACDERGAIVFPRNVVSFTDKTRYLFHVSKGLVGPEHRNRPFEVNRKVPAARLRVPFDQMVFVGDGYTDVPCFAMVRDHGGVAIGVYSAQHRERWGRAWGFIEDGRVSNLVPADYRQGSALSNSLVMAVESMARRIALRRSTYQG